jgi:hypothetical protein
MTTDKTNSSSFLCTYVRWTSPSSPRRPHRCGSSLFGCCRPPQPHKPRNLPTREAPPTKNHRNCSRCCIVTTAAEGDDEDEESTRPVGGVGGASAVVVGYPATLLLGHVTISVGGRIHRPEERRVRHGAAVVLAVGVKGKRQAECMHAYVVDDDTNQPAGSVPAPTTCHSNSSILIVCELPVRSTDKSRVESDVTLRFTSPTKWTGGISSGGRTCGPLPRPSDNYAPTESSGDGCKAKLPSSTLRTGEGRCWRTPPRWNCA